MFVEKLRACLSSGMGGAPLKTTVSILKLFFRAVLVLNVAEPCGGVVG